MIKKIKYFKNNFKGFFEIDEIKIIESAPVLLFCHDFTRNYKFEGKKYSSLIDTLNDLFISNGINTLTIERPYSNFDKNECYGKIIKVNGSYARARFLDFIFNLIFKNKKNYFQEKLWNKILIKTKSKVLIGIEPFKDLTISAKKLGIIVFDLQHGIINSIPPPHFYKLELRSPTQNGWPNFVICRDLESLLFLKINRENYTSPILIGHPWMSRFFSNKKSDKLLKDVEINFKNFFTKPIILFSLQHLRDEFGRPNGYSKIPDLLIKVIKSDFGNKFQWCIRLHPILINEPNFTLVKNDLSIIFNNYKNVEWELSTKIPLPYLLKYTRLHFTRDSSTAFEAAQFNIKTGLLDKPESKNILINNFKSLIDKNNAYILSLNDEDLLKMFIEKNIEKNNFDQSSLELQNRNFELYVSILIQYINNEIKFETFNDILIKTFNSIYANNNIK